MAVAPTGDIFKTLEFDGESSKDYGVYITGEAVFNAPERDIEMISIPGRSGSFALDKGRFENIEVRYPAGIFADNELDFAEAISDFRNFLCSKKGYCRLTDDYNPDEYRLAIYRSGLEVTPAMLKAGEFEIVFDCKPQRYLMSGEAPIEVSNNEVIFNPTLYEANPLLEVEGYGDITLNGYEIVINDDVIGELELAPATLASASYACDYRSKSALIEDGDSMVLDSFSVELDIALNSSSGNPYNRIQSVTFSRTNSSIPNYIGVDTTNVSNKEIKKIIKYGEQSFIKQSSAVEYTDSCSVTVSVRDSGVTTTDYTFTFDIRIKLQGAGTSQGKGHLLIELRNATRLPSTYFRTTLVAFSASRFIAISTQSILGHPTYIDCEVGEAYKIINSQLMPLNRYIVLGSKLPTLSVGENEVEYGGSITDLKIIPRWWQI